MERRHALLVVVLLFLLLLLVLLVLLVLRLVVLLLLVLLVILLVLALLLCYTQRSNETAPRPLLPAKATNKPLCRFRTHTSGRPGGGFAALGTLVGDSCRLSWLLHPPLYRADTQNTKNSPDTPNLQMGYHQRPVKCYAASTQTRSDEMSIMPTCVGDILTPRIALPHHEVGYPGAN